MRNLPVADRSVLPVNGGGRSVRRMRLLALLLVTASVAAASDEPASDKPASNDPLLSCEKPNRLASQRSPYLLQHACDPVDWHAWSDEAFARARRENKPVFLSIGYSTCHWCHVMARESFRNEAVARYLNRHFIAIKVDRELRPDIDTVYLAATRLINGHAGWPMSVFVDAGMRPFYATTYLPPFDRDGQRGLMTVLKEIHRLWTQTPQTVRTLAARLTSRVEAVLQDDTAGDVTSLPENLESEAMAALTARFDFEAGGVDTAPKFPEPGILAFLNALLESGSDFDEDARQMLRLTLDNMAYGGLYDQLGGGFHRYSVDRHWLRPHFEKMLYTQALLVMAYNRFLPFHESEKYRQVIRETLAFVEREMMSPEGTFYAALDADSRDGETDGAHEEGAWYRWREADLRTLLDDDERAFARDYFGLSGEVDFSSQPNAGRALFVAPAYRRQLTGEQRRLYRAVVKKMRRARAERPRPWRDDKVIAGWNGMMIRAFAEVAGALEARDRPAAKHNYRIASRAMRSLLDRLFEPRSGKLYRQYRGTYREGDAVLNDYVWLISALLSLHAVHPEDGWRQWIDTLAAAQDAALLDRCCQCYFDAAGSGIQPLFRSRNIVDDALPAGNAVALENRLRRLAGTHAADRPRAPTQLLPGAFAARVNRQPLSSAYLLSVLLLSQAHKVR